MQPPAPHVTVTNKGRRALDMRSSRVCRLEKPYSFDQLSSLVMEGNIDYLSFWGEEFKREVVSIIGKCSDLVRYFLHN